MLYYELSITTCGNGSINDMCGTYMIYTDVCITKKTLDSTSIGVLFSFSMPDLAAGTDPNVRNTCGDVR